MQDSKVKKLPLPEVTVDDIFKAEGADYSQRQPRPGMVELRLQIIKEAEELVKLAAIWKEVKVTGIGPQQLYLDGGYGLTSKLLTKVAEKSEKLLLLVMTIGDAIDKRISDYSKEGKMSEAFALDAAGSAYISKGSQAFFTEFEEHYKKEGLKTTFPMGPGHSYWSHLEDIKVIFELLQPEKIGLHLTESNLIMPRKSIAFVMGVGSELPESHGKRHCDFCSIKSTCYMSEATI